MNELKKHDEARGALEEAGRENRRETVRSQMEKLDAVKNQLDANGRKLEEIDKGLTRLGETTRRYTVLRSNIQWIRKVFGFDYTIYAIIGPGLEKPYIVTNETAALELSIRFESVFLAGRKSRGGSDDTP